MFKRVRKISASRKTIYADRVKAYNKYEEKVLRESLAQQFGLMQTAADFNAAINNCTY